MNYLHILNKKGGKLWRSAKSIMDMIRLKKRREETKVRARMTQKITPSILLDIYCIEFLSR